MSQGKKAPSSLPPFGEWSCSHPQSEARQHLKWILSSGCFLELALHSPSKLHYSFWVEKEGRCFRESAIARKVPGTFQLRAFARTKPGCYVRFPCPHPCQPWEFWRCLPSQLQNERSGRDGASSRVGRKNGLIGYGYPWAGSTHLSMGQESPRSHAGAGQVTCRGCIFSDQHLNGRVIWCGSRRSAGCF